MTLRARVTRHAPGSAPAATFIRSPPTGSPARRLRPVSSIPSTGSGLTRSTCSTSSKTAPRSSSRVAHTPMRSCCASPPIPRRVAACSPSRRARRAARASTRTPTEHSATSISGGTRRLHVQYVDTFMRFSSRSLRAVVRSWAERVQAFLAALPLWPLPAQRIVQQFREAGALTPQTARSFHARSRPDEDAFIQLLRTGVIREPVRGRYYLDEGSLAELRRQGLLPWEIGRASCRERV